MSLRNMKVDIDGTKVEAPRNIGLTLGKVHEGMNKYPVLCVIFSKRGRSYQVDMDWAGLFRKDDVDYYKLKKRKGTFKPPHYSSVMTTTSGRNILLLQNLTRDEYYPMEVPNDSNWLQFAENQQAIRGFLINEVMRIKIKGQGFFEKNLPIITMVIMFMMFILGAYIMWDSFGKIVMQDQIALGGLSRAVANLTSSITGGKPLPAW